MQANGGECKQMQANVSKQKKPNASKRMQAHAHMYQSINQTQIRVNEFDHEADTVQLHTDTNNRLF